MIVKKIDAHHIRNHTFYNHIFADCIIVTPAKKVLLQKRDSTCESFPNAITPFGGHVETGESAENAVIREIEGELGLLIPPAEIHFLCAIEEINNDSMNLIYMYVWHDNSGMPILCNEGYPVYFDTINHALNQRNLMAHAKIALRIMEEMR